MLKKDRYKAFVDYFSTHQPEAETELHYQNAFQLLVAVILSAQCTDKRVNQVTEHFFKYFPNPQSLANATIEEVFLQIRSISYPQNKSKYLIGMAQKLIRDFQGEVPKEVEDLQTLPGVGRKTAHVVASVIYNAPLMAVDTHVFRVANRIGLTEGATTPLQVEKQLTDNLPKTKIHLAHHWLILHGRYICTAKKPKCTICPLTTFCKYYQTQYKKPETSIRKNSTTPS